MVPGQVTGREFEYVRHGTLCLMGAFDVQRGKPFGRTWPGHSAGTFVNLLDLIDARYPTGRGNIVCDNFSAYDTDDVLDWFEDHLRWMRHFTPKHASWLRQIEGMFFILQKHVLVRGSFVSPEDSQEKIYTYTLWYSENAEPFEWSYRPKSWSKKSDKTSGGRH